MRSKILYRNEEGAKKMGAQESMVGVVGTSRTALQLTQIHCALCAEGVTFSVVYVAHGVLEGWVATWQVSHQRRLA